MHVFPSSLCVTRDTCDNTDVMTAASLCHAGWVEDMGSYPEISLSGNISGDTPHPVHFETNNQFCKICAWEIWIIIRGRECIFCIVDKL